jgi:hypothetical protein
MEERSEGMDERIYKGENEEWFYRARGNHSVGPFENYHSAEKALTKQINSWSGKAGPIATWPRQLKPSRIFRRSATRHS